MLKGVAGITHDYFALTIAQALLGAYILNVNRAFPFMLWHVLRGLMNWHIWKAWSTLAMDEMHIPVSTIKTKIWKDLRVYMHIRWDALRNKVQEGRLPMMEARGQMHKDYGIDEHIFLILGDRIDIAYLPLD